jgi:predicted NAD-dependent protein-ADP-ribosyltransferase YbiA (DUF1768 family)
MNKCSYFIKDKALFGSYPEQHEVDELELNGVRYFVNLTQSFESKIIPYKTKYNYISFPITDRRIPSNWNEYSKFIIFISNIITSLQGTNKLFLHCKGGHGRSGIVVACILCYILKINPIKALEKTQKYHSRRITMKDKWRHIGSPQTKYQKDFVCRFNEPLIFFRTFSNKYTDGFSLFSNHPINIELTNELNLPNIDTINSIFPNAQSAIEAYKDPKNKNYIDHIKNNKNPLFIPIPTMIRNDWIEIKRYIMKKIILLKLNQYPIIRYNLLGTGLRPIVYYSKTRDTLPGELLTEIRNELYQI